MDIYLAAEDALSLAAMRRCVEVIRPDINIAVPMQLNGRSKLRSKVVELFRLAHSLPVVVIADLDQDECAPGLLREWIGGRAVPVGLLLRFAVREVEAWLLADHESFSEFTGILRNKLPPHPESIRDPKQTLLNLVRAHGSRRVKMLLLPSEKVDALTGIEYNSALCEYVRTQWSPKLAASRSDSVRRTCDRILHWCA